MPVQLHKGSVGITQKPATRLHDNYLRTIFSTPSTPATCSMDFFFGTHWIDSPWVQHRDQNYSPASMCIRWWIKASMTFPKECRFTSKTLQCWPRPLVNPPNEPWYLSCYIYHSWPQVLLSCWPHTVPGSKNLMNCWRLRPNHQYRRPKTCLFDAANAAGERYSQRRPTRIDHCMITARRAKMITLKCLGMI